MNNRIGCLVIHGFGGTVTEVEPLVSHLNKLGYQVMTPNLKGHTGNRRDLKNIDYTEWISSAETDLWCLQSCCEIVYVIGFSMGGLIAVNLGVKHTIAGIITINTPIYYWNVKQIISNIASDITARDFNNTRRYLKSSVELPFSALFNFRLLLNKTKPRIKGLTCPILIAQAIHDDTVRKSSANYIYDHVSSEVKQLKFYNSSQHLLLWSTEADVVMKHISEFIKQLSSK